MTKYPELTIPRSEVDTFAASAVLNEAAAFGTIPKDYVAYLKELASQLAADVLAGKPVLTMDDNGNTVSVKLADEPVGDKQ